MASITTGFILATTTLSMVLRITLHKNHDELLCERFGVAAITITSGGAGYTSAPVVSFTGGVERCGSHSNRNWWCGCRYHNHFRRRWLFTSAPTISFTGGGGSGATASATVGETNVTVTPPQAAGAVATATVTGGVVTAITITSGGTGYIFAPTISFRGESDSDAAATATVTGGVVTAITITSGGTGYTSAPTISITGGDVAARLASFKTPATAIYNFVKSALKERFVVLPPCGAVVGVYAATDSNRGCMESPGQYKPRQRYRTGD